MLVAVPNAPCGVESSVDKSELRHALLFLMHRVELKVAQPVNPNQSLLHLQVPNAPCGVERTVM